MSPSLKFSEAERLILKPIFDYSKSNKRKLYLVGGVLRDKLLGRSKGNPDFDFCLKKGALSFGRQLAKKIKTAYIVLDQEHGACRLAKRINGVLYTFDFTDFRGPEIKDDLLHRDFTINSMALELEQVFISQDLNSHLIAPYFGQADLKRKMICLTHKDSFIEDPLRILRAFAFSSMLDFKLEDKLLKSAKAQRSKLADVSAERVRDELFKIFESPSVYSALVNLDKLKLLEVIFPEIKKMRGIGQGPYHHLDVWQHTLETVKQLELLAGEFRRNQNIGEYLNQELSGIRRRFALLKFAGLLHDVGKPKALRHEKGKIIFHGHERVGLGLTRLICRRIKLSNEECASLERIVLWHLRPGYLADYPVLSARAKFRYFRDTGPDALAVLLLSLADQRATEGPLTTSDSRLRHEKTVSRLIKELFKKKGQKKPRLVDGNDIMRKLKLPASPLIGKILSRLEELQAIGKIHTKKQALKAAKNVAHAKK